MKSKKNNLTTGIIIGIGMIVVPLILMGTSNTNYVTEKKNTYEIHGKTSNFLLNTETGEVWYLQHVGEVKRKYTEKPPAAK
jgi:hypothetical protein